MGGDHGAVRRFVKLHSQIGQPADGLGRFRDQLVKQILLGGKMPAAVSVQKMLGRRIVGLVGSLDAAFRHHGIGIAHPQLGHQQHLGAVFMGLDGCRAARAAAADDQHIGIIVRVLQIHRRIPQPGLALQQGSQFGGHLVAFVGAEAQRRKPVVPVVGMEGLQQLFLFLRGHPPGIQLSVFLPRRFHQTE